VRNEDEWRSNTLHAAVTEAAIPSSTLQSKAKDGCYNIEEESEAISNCFWEDDGLSLEEVNALFDTSPLPDIELVLGYDAGQLWFSATETLNNMAADTFQS